MKKLKNRILLLIVVLNLCIPFCLTSAKIETYAYDEDTDYYTVYTSGSDEVLFVKGGEISVEDEYISCDNKLYRVTSVDTERKTGVAEFVDDVKMPVYNVIKNDDLTEVSAQESKKIGLYHTHNDECYNDADGTDSVYGEGGIHDVGAKLKENLENCGITVYYDESLHLPHDSGAYTRSQPTAKSLLNNGLDALFDVHRDATPRSEYLTTVNGEQMSKVRMVIGSANQNSEQNKQFALNIKAYADEVYPNLIKDIYIGKGNYNQQLFERALLFEFGTNLIEKELVLRSTKPLAKTIDVVLYGTQGAGENSLKDIDAVSSSGTSLKNGLVNSKEVASTTTGLSTTSIVLIVVGAVVLTFLLVMIFSKKARVGVSKFFREMFAFLSPKKNQE